MIPRDHDGSQTSERYGIHASKIRNLLPDLISVSEHSAPEWPDNDECQKKNKQQLAAPEQPTYRGEEKVEQLFHRQ